MLRIKRDPLTSVVLEQQQQQQEYVPLKRVNVEATIRAFAADVTITQVFRNDETTPIEAVYCFPIEEQAAIYTFVARIDDREISAQLKEKKEAQRDYNNALQQGDGAYLLEQDEKSQDNFIINVGALPPSKECTITISYITELDLVQGSTIRFVVPTTIAPRYNPDKGSIALPLNTTSKYAQSTPYTIDFRCYIEKTLGSRPEQITRVNSSSHPIEINLAQQDAYVVTFAQQNTHLDRDILINIELSDKRNSTIMAVEPGAVMAAFIPTEDECRQASKNDLTNEFIFIVDCSGSMKDENKIGLARQAMLLFLKSLPVNCHFNIVRFGSQYKTLFSEITAVYNETNAQQAEALIQQIQADLGGTELLRPLQWIEEHSPSQGRARQIFLLTDGEISNVTEVLDLCRSMATSTRIFSFGLGQSPSRSLVKDLARATNGRFVFIPPNASVDIYVGEQLQKALQPCITNVHVKWNLGVPVQSAPTQSPPVYVNDRLIVYALIDDKTTPFDHNSSVELQTELDHRSLGVAKVDHIPSVSDSGTIARLAAKALILQLQHAKLPSSNTKRTKTGSTQARFQEFQETTATNEEKMKTSLEETAKQRIIALSLKYNILSPYTAFVGIEKRMNASNIDLVLREVPIQISGDDQHLQMFGRGAGSSRGLGFGGGAHRHRKIMAGNCYELNFNGCQPLPRSSIDSASLILENACSDDEDDIFANLTSKKEKRKSLEKETWPSNDQDIVRHLINKQKFDGLWSLDSQDVKNLTGKTLADFLSENSQIDHHVLVSAIIIAVLETRFAALTTMWYGVVQKARKCLTDLLRIDSKNLDQLLENIRKQF
ncbi:unnamed protein product [Didymodactylos carnosus]|uniref:Uncharacterized protein n=1 Tax=Didymodactylos carnosus TaxID=1234261 RepID=A0A814K870_9BILA|nr:unnamed protein product [Didymodactylos carnosus]CAF1143698.1 unnamed protein product [Didymodactylos carnosus]CAF3815777.1 unnamed protein product [Didymodactylos carnosus]CAF3942808.1 unnamed protein product [Didymodactylos carnosus]